MRLVSISIKRARHEVILIHYSEEKRAKGKKTSQFAFAKLDSLASGTFFHLLRQTVQLSKKLLLIISKEKNNRLILIHGRHFGIWNLFSSLASKLSKMSRYISDCS